MLFASSIFILAEKHSSMIHYIILNITSEEGKTKKRKDQDEISDKSKVITKSYGRVLVACSKKGTGGCFFINQKGISTVEFMDGPKKLAVPESWKQVEDSELNEFPQLADAKRQLLEYFAGERYNFELKYDLNGTPFQMSVWQELLKIPYGETLSYGDIAKNLGNPSASRAVGSANNKNPVAICVPCHRVIGSSGSLTGYYGGLEIKASLLELEKMFAAVSKVKVKKSKYFS